MEMMGSAIEWTGWDCSCQMGKQELKLHVTNRKVQEASLGKHFTRRERETRPDVLSTRVCCISPRNNKVGWGVSTLKKSKGKQASKASARLFWGWINSVNHNPLFPSFCCCRIYSFPEGGSEARRGTGGDGG